MESRIPDCLTPRPEDPTWRAPLDEFDLAVRLETEGVTDEVARAIHGFNGTLDMAGACFPALSARQAQTPSLSPALSGWREWLRGTAFALPMLICALSMLTIGVSLWGGDLPADLASSVAVATVASLVLSGGFVQAMSRRALFHMGAANISMAAGLTRAWSQVAIAALLITALVGLVANVIFSWMPAALAGQTAAFFVMLGLLWLGCGGLYIVNRPAWISGATVAGIAVVALLHRGLGVTLHTAQLAGVAVAVVIAFYGAISWFRARGASSETRNLLVPAREIYLAAPYFAYGAFYYLFLFADRLIAWTAGTNAAALPLQFRGDYETALDLAMAAFILQTGLVHSSLAGFHRAVELAQRAVPAGRYEKFNADLRDFFWWRMARLAAFGFATSGLVFFIVTRLGLLPFANMRPVLVVALIAYPIMVAGLWNTSLLFALSQPRPVVASVALGAFASLGSGYLLSRMGSYDAAAVGFLIGAFIFAAISCAAVLQSFTRLDATYYASSL